MSAASACPERGGSTGHGGGGGVLGVLGAPWRYRGACWSTGSIMGILGGAGRPWGVVVDHGGAGVPQGATGYWWGNLECRVVEDPG